MSQHEIQELKKAGNINEIRRYLLEHYKKSGQQDIVIEPPKISPIRYGYRSKN